MAISIGNSGQQQGGNFNRPQKARQEDIAKSYITIETLPALKTNINDLMRIRDGLFSDLNAANNSRLSSFKAWLKHEHPSLTKEQLAGLTTPKITTLDPLISISNPPERVYQNIDLLSDQINLLVTFLGQKYRQEILQYQQMLSGGVAAVRNMRSTQALITERKKAISDLYNTSLHLSTRLSGLIEQYSNTPDSILEKYTNSSFKNNLKQIQANPLITGIDIFANSNRQEVMTFLSYLLSPEDYEQLSVRNFKSTRTGGVLTIGNGASRHEFSTKKEFQDHLWEVLDLEDGGGVNMHYSYLVNTISDLFFSPDTNSTNSVAAVRITDSGATPIEQTRFIATRILNSINSYGGRDGRITEALANFRAQLSPDINNQKSPLNILKNIAKEQQIQLNEAKITNGGGEIEALADLVPYEAVVPLPPLPRYGGNPQNIPNTPSNQAPQVDLSRYTQNSSNW